MDDKNLLASLKEAIVSKVITADVTIGGMKYSLRSLNEGENLWKDKEISLESNASFITSERISTLAIGIYAINGNSVETIFGIDPNLPKYTRTCYAASALLDLLLGADRNTIIELSEKYQELIVDKVNELKKNSKKPMKNSKEKISDSEQDNTSSQKKES